MIAHPSQPEVMESMTYATRMPEHRNPRTQEDEIPVDADHVHDHPRPSELIELFQISHLRSSMSHYTIFEDHFLSVHLKTPMRKAKRYWVDLGTLDPTPHLLAIVDRRSLCAVASLSFLTIILLITSALSDTAWHQQAWMPVTALLFSASLIAFFVFFYRSGNIVRFHSRSGDAVFLEMANNAPSRKEFMPFMRILIHHIQAAHKQDRRKPHQKLGMELREHRRLRDAGVLDNEAYEQAREKILRRFRQSNIRPLPTHKSEPAWPDMNNADVVEVTVSNGYWQEKTSNIDLFTNGGKQPA